MTSNQDPHILVVAPGPLVRGGITAVISAYREDPLWRNYNCHWLSTYDDRGWLPKIYAAARAAVLFIPRARGKDIVHIHVAHKGSVCRKALFFWMARLLRKKIVLHLHSPDDRPFSAWPDAFLARRMFKRADVVIALSEMWAQKIREVVPQANVKVIPNPCSRPKGKRQTTKEPRILFSGKLEERKGYRDLIRAMPAVLAEIPEARLVFAGHGNLDKAGRLVKELGVADNVDFLGWVRDDRKTDTLTRATVFCLPSFGEGVPMAMLEAMSYEIPVIVTPVGGIPDVIENGKNGLLVTPGCHSEIAAAIIKLLKDEELSSTMAKEGLNFVKNNYWPDVICRHICDLYDQLAENDVQDG